MTDARPNPDWRPLALSLALLTAAYAVLYRFIPHDQKAYLLFPFGAWALYSGARLTTRVALPLTIGVFALTDLALYAGNAVPPNYLFYLLLGVYVLVGRGLLARSQAAWRIMAGSVGGYTVFFLVTNFAAWLEVALPEYAPHSLDTLLLAYRKGLEFLRMQPGHLIGDVVLSFGLFGAHAALARVYSPAEQVAAQGAV